MIKYNVNTCDQITNEFIVHFTKKCPNKCPFCIDALNEGLSNSPQKPDVDAIYETIQKHKGLIRSICISGGEPLLFIDEVYELIKMVKSETDLQISLITSLPQTAYNKKGVLFDIIEMCDAFAISPQHYDEDIADEMRGHKSMYDRQKFYGDLPNKDKITININLVKPYLYAKDEICKCIKHYNDMGYRNIKVSELFNADDMYVSFEDVFDVKLKSPFAHGCQTAFDITPWVPSFEGKFVLKRVCFLVSKQRHANFCDMFKASTRSFFAKKYNFGVVYEDGSLHPYWI